MSGDPDDAMMRKHVHEAAAQLLDKPFMPNVLARTFRRAREVLEGRAA